MKERLVFLVDLLLTDLLFDDFSFFSFLTLGDFLGVLVETFVGVLVGLFLGGDFLGVLLFCLGILF